ncbi:MAG: hypothetical protein ABSE73_27545 [Planctomycetota bacterium]
MRNLYKLALFMLPGVLFCIARGEEKPWQDSFNLDEQNLGPTGKNPYFILEPGYQLVCQGEEEGEDTVITITVLNETKKIGNVETSVVEERETEDGELSAITKHYYAVDKTTNSVYYFGADVDVYEDGKVAGHKGSWRAGANGAKYGLMMPGAPQAGDRYCQQTAPGAAMDRAEVEDLSETVKTPAGEFKNCLKIKETSALDPAEKSYRYYAADIGLVRDGELKLIKHGQTKK